MNPSKPRVTSTDYNNIARFYSSITKLVSTGGNTRAQCFFLDYINSGDTVLNIGCGSVDFNVELSRKSSNVVALDIAPNMIAIAKDKLAKQGGTDSVKFVCSDIMSYNSDHKFDVIFANFFLNTFEWSDCDAVADHIISLLKPGGIICIADETHATKLSTRFSVKAFRPFVQWVHHLWANQPVHDVYDYTDLFSSKGFEPVIQKRDKTDFIMSTIYKQV